MITKDKNIFTRKSFLKLGILVLILGSSVLLAYYMNQRNLDIRSGAASTAPVSSLELPTTLNTTFDGTTTIDVPVRINPNTGNVVGFDISLTFDKTFLQLVSVTPDTSNVFKSFFPISSSNSFDVNKVVTNANRLGKVEFTAVAMDSNNNPQTPYRGASIKVATLKFKPLRSGTTSISFNNGKAGAIDTNIARVESTTDGLVRVTNLTNLNISNTR